jgi:hypothetical protein
MGGDGRVTKLRDAWIILGGVAFFCLLLIELATTCAADLLRRPMKRTP